VFIAILSYEIFSLCSGSKDTFLTLVIQIYCLVFYKLNKSYIALIMLLLVLNGCVSKQLSNDPSIQNALLIHADRVFDGLRIRSNTSVLIVDGKIVQIAAQGKIKAKAAEIIDLGDATLLPGFIELHAHLNYKKIPAETVLKHGITTIRDLGGPVHKPYGGKGSLRVISSGPIITAVGGYPIPVLGEKDIAIPVATQTQARLAVQDLVEQGAAIIKIALEPGGEQGAPWSSHHGHHKPAHHSHAVHATESTQKWPLLSLSVVKVIVEEAHRLGRKVTAHIGEQQGAEIAINAGVDEWAHIPCDVIPEELLERAVKQQIKMLTTIDTLSKCSGIFHNLKVLSSLGAEFLYGAEIAHPDIPWGIDVQELIYLQNKAKMTALEVLTTITSKAGQHLNIPLLGTLRANAPADMIAVKGNVIDDLKRLEYPDLVLSGGQIIVNNFSQ